jgi:peptidoglycan/LPS O-acetylase OafA/YrhL
MTTRREKVLRVASVCALIGLALMVWSVVDPRPLPVLLGLSVGQAIGTASFLLYLLVIASDLRLRKKLEGPDSQR